MAVRVKKSGASPSVGWEISVYRRFSWVLGRLVPILCRSMLRKRARQVVFHVMCRRFFVTRWGSLFFYLSVFLVSDFDACRGRHVVVALQFWACLSRQTAAFTEGTRYPKSNRKRSILFCPDRRFCGPDVLCHVPSVLGRCMVCGALQSLV